MRSVVHGESDTNGEVVARHGCECGQSLITTVRESLTPTVCGTPARTTCRHQPYPPEGCHPLGINRDGCHVTIRGSAMDDYDNELAEAIADLQVEAITNGWEITRIVRWYRVLADFSPGECGDHINPYLPEHGMWVLGSAMGTEWMWVTPIDPATNPCRTGVRIIVPTLAAHERQDVRALRKGITLLHEIGLNRVYPLSFVNDEHRCFIEQLERKSSESAFEVSCDN